MCVGVCINDKGTVSNDNARKICMKIESVTEKTAVQC